MEDLTSLVSVTVSFPRVSASHLWVKFLKGIIGAKSLPLSPPCFVTSNSSLSTFPNLKHLELLKSFYLEWPLIFQYLESCSELEHLCIEEPKDICWSEPQSVPTCMLNHLRTMKFSKF